MWNSTRGIVTCTDSPGFDSIRLGTHWTWQANAPYLHRYRMWAWSFKRSIDRFCVGDCDEIERELETPRPPAVVVTGRLVTNPRLFESPESPTGRDFARIFGMRWQNPLE